MGNGISITVYGAEQLCASCVNLPSSKDTYEWLQAAIDRKYGADAVQYEYVDIFAPPNVEKHEQFARRVIEEDLFYPVVLVDDEIAGEGNPKLKTIYRILEEKGLHAQS
ncbi:YuzD family protein [Salirhabdus salicampi]|uniref:YuzD family protein n=1 Tax=Salirhabdus salicampi TaxID=476102 RepID=UPI0020C3B305|nr:YuzD family protein [Salirhabdus salicampi]MCP8617761.1 YuzD family protein [Salirhabdus salicampi]